MKTIGLIGGLSWVSSREYYSILNAEYNQRKGNNHSCPIVMYSFDFDLIQQYQKEGNWDRLCELMSEAAIRLEKGGADLILICSNTMHSCADAMQSRIMIPILHITDAIGEAVTAHGLTRVGLMGTRYLMRMPIYSDRLRNKYSVEPILPEENEIEIIDNIIYNELVKDQINGRSKKQILKITGNLAGKGAQGIILACTELPMILQDVKIKIPIFNSTKIHALYGLEFAMKEHLYA